ncbi:hypothetical protein PM082_024919 [Marasmius tenuissimus]|nr:hypothetical protein PM082_024919 [Marasmius tenuissimus]
MIRFAGEAEFNVFSGLEIKSIETQNDDLTPQSIILLCFFVGIMCSNLLLTGMIGGRVFYISHRVAKLAKRPVTRMYKTVIHASIESGIIYPLMLLLFTIFASLGYRYVLTDKEPDARFALAMSICSVAVYESFVPVMVSKLPPEVKCIIEELHVGNRFDFDYRTLGTGSCIQRRRILQSDHFKGARFKGESRVMTDRVFDIRRSNGLAVHAGPVRG